MPLYGSFKFIKLYQTIPEHSIPPNQVLSMKVPRVRGSAQSFKDQKGLAERNGEGNFRHVRTQWMFFDPIHNAVVRSSRVRDASHTLNPRALENIASPEVCLSSTSSTRSLQIFS